MPDPERFQPETPHIQADQIPTLGQLFPEIFSEGKIDLEKLRLILGDQVIVLCKSTRDRQCTHSKLI